MKTPPTQPEPAASPARPGHVWRVRARAAADHRGVLHAPADALFTHTNRGPELIALDSPCAIGRHPAATGATDLPRPGHLLLPALVNAHTHLDLTHLGPIAIDPGDDFGVFARTVAQGRHTHAESIAESVRAGAALSLAGGVVAVGDIAGQVEQRTEAAAARALRESPLIGVSFLECFGLGARESAWLDHLDHAAHTHDAWFRAPDRGVRLGLQPHAPYSTSPRVYNRCVEIAARTGCRLSTHLAEHNDERRFVASAEGPGREFIERLGIWDPRLADDYGLGRHPVEHARPALAAARLAQTPMLCAHVNDATDDAIETLARTAAHVVYCPRSSASFAHERTFGPHRYRDMLDAGVNVCLGTDSILHLDTPDRISTLDEMRLLHRRDGTDPARLLEMATVRGARALHLDESAFTLRPGSVAGLFALDISSRPGAGRASVNLLAEALYSGDAPECIAGPALAD